MTSNSATTPTSPHPVALSICSALVGAATLALLTFIATGLVGGDSVSIDAIALLEFLAIVIGCVGGLIGAARLLAAPGSWAADAAWAIYLLTLLAVPVLLYVIGGVLFLSSFQSSQY
jgi:hypothetical protein